MTDFEFLVNTSSVGWPGLVRRGLPPSRHNESSYRGLFWHP